VLNENQKDAMIELLNIGMGAAASSLSEMVDDEVKLSIPDIELLTPKVAAQILNDRVSSSVSAVHQDFEGPIWGKALLFFPEEKSLELVRAVLGESMPVEVIGEMAQEGMTEIGNVILNACLSSLADMFGNQIHTEVPEYFNGKIETLFGVDGETADKSETLLLLKMEFNLKEREINGYVSFLMSIDSIRAFLDSINEYMGIELT